MTFALSSFASEAFVAFLGILKKQIHRRKIVQNVTLKCKFQNMVHTIHNFPYIFNRLNTMEMSVLTQKYLISSLSYCSNAVDFCFAF